MEKIAVTGGIGSGKSTVVRYLAKQYGLPVIDVDLECKNLLLPGRAGLEALTARFGQRFLASGGHLDRLRLRRALFADEELRREIDTIIHPLVREVVEHRLGQSMGPYILVDVPLLFEAGWEDDFDRIIVVFADSDARCRRIVRRDHVGWEEAQQAVRAQIPLWRKVGMADHVIDNSFCSVFTRLQCVHLAEGILGLLATHPGDTPFLGIRSESPV